MTELVLRAAEIHLGDGPGNSGLCWMWQFELPNNPGNVNLRLDARDCQKSKANGVWLNDKLIGYLKVNTGSGYEANIITISDSVLDDGSENHHFLQIYSGYISPQSKTDWTRDDIYMRNIRVVHD